MSAAPIEEISAVFRALRAAGAGAHVGGSFASSVHGVPRSTRDVDLVVDLSPSQVKRFLSALGGRFLADETTVLAALAAGRSFNLIGIESAFKVDCFPLGDKPYDGEEWCRAAEVELEPGVTLRIKSAEDVVLRKLEWFRLGGGVSDRQWSDVLGVLRTRSDSIDRAYLRKWAVSLGVAELLERAIGEA